MGGEHRSEAEPERAERPRGVGAQTGPVAAPSGHSERVLGLQRQAGNTAVLRALGLSPGRTLARDPDPASAAAPWTFSPLKPGAAPTGPDIYPWLNKDPAKRMQAEEDLLWAASRPSKVLITVSASGLSAANKTVVDKPPPPAPDPAAGSSATSTPAASPTSAATPPPTTTSDVNAPAPETVPVAAGHPEVKGVQVQVSWGLAAERHTAPAGSGGAPTSDWQSSGAVALTVVYHDDDKPGWEWSTQFQVNWSDAKVLRAMSPTALQNIQIGSQIAYVLPLWKNAQWQIFGQVMVGAGPDGKSVAQAAAGGQLQIKLGKHLSLFLQGNVGTTDTQGSGVTGDASVQGGAIYTF